MYIVLVECDIIALYEIKTSLPISFPGYVSYTSRDLSNSHRGGTCVLVKQCFDHEVSELDISIIDQVWFKLKCFPDVFGFCYVPPSDSPYFNHTLFSNMQKKVKGSHDNNKGCIVMGDMNARFGNAVRELPASLVLDQYSYQRIPDPIQPHDNAIALLGICVDEKLLVVNNVCCNEMMYSGNLTYRQA